MGIGPGSRSSSRLPRRAFYPSGPWIDGIRPADDHRPGVATQEPPAGNPDPNNYQIVKAEEKKGWLVVMINYPGCNNYEGNKILLFKGMTLVQLVNQKLIDPHFFPGDKKYKSPVARFVPTDEGWAMALALVGAIGPMEKT